MSVLAGKNILITGGTGSFGNAFARRCLADGAKRVVIFSRDELKQAQMRAALADERLRFFVGSVTSQQRLEQAMNGVDTVIHAAAMKRIEVCEENVWQAVEVNVEGTRNVALAAIACGVGRAIMLSTDKAPAACTAYGMTKALAERGWIQSNVYAAGTITMLSAVRYGNVLASRGSVVGLFRDQHARGEPLTITDHAMTRFWLRIEDAVNLVVLALEEMRGGEVFIPKAPSSTIGVLACAVVPDAKHFHVIGLRPNERLHETLISADEARSTYDAGTHYVIEPEARTWEEVDALDYPKVPPDFVYRSDLNPQRIGVEEMRKLLQERLP